MAAAWRGCRGWGCGRPSWCEWRRLPLCARPLPEWMSEQHVRPTGTALTPCRQAAASSAICMLSSYIAERESRGQIGTTLLSRWFRHLFTSRPTFETSGRVCRSDWKRLRTVRERQSMCVPSKHKGTHPLATPEMAQAGQPETVYGTAAKFDIGGKPIRQRNR